MLLFQIDHKYFLILISRTETWYTERGVCLLVGELAFISGIGVELTLVVAKPWSQVQSFPCTQAWDCVTSGSPICGVMCHQSLMWPWADYSRKKYNSALGLKAAQNPPAAGFRGPTLRWLSWFCGFFYIQHLSIGCRSDLRQPHCHDRWDRWTVKNLETSHIR